MFKVNKLTDYAMVVLIDIACADGRRSAHQVSDHTGIPLPTVAKLMKSLNKAGLVASQRGATGGYALGRQPREISVADVIEAVEGPIALTACADTSDETCSMQSSCLVQGKWNRVNRAVRAALTDVTLAEMIADICSFGLLPIQRPRDLAAVGG
ncbi:MAG: SUF system Fe-S cluster assembly regulator [Alphaproteobacteria bacterium]|jgi:FeS assembly SUF system regulator|nr:SUF system Fe-S cluster assembly regulator [Alphaproteobacteria bacterium]PHY00740.1 MAG: SUF system Fe-S cluster assembly regulator [Rhodospirillaceae bacterium]